MRQRALGTKIVGLALVAVGCGGGAASTQGSLRNDAGASAPDAPADVRTDAAIARLFPEGAPWYRDVSALPVDVESQAIIAAVTSAGGFGGGEFLIDFGFEVNMAGSGATPTELTPGPGFSL